MASFSFGFPGIQETFWTVKDIRPVACHCVLSQESKVVDSLPTHGMIVLVAVHKVLYHCDIGQPGQDNQER